ncbi:hypothetical protein O3G_MSEX009909 [Manduca sexta]|uniref:Uncharacterized protein n=2 Tax=Manduca sexta TaxID=7130 RepID=A0A921ZF53_MANSE|nr:hypothetical protein O3G_MSEX009909 [Manduca sexta]
MFRFTWILFLLLPTFQAVNVKIDGIIDLGPNWNYKYTLQTVKHNDRLKSFTHLEKRSRDETNRMKLVDQSFYATDNISVPTEKYNSKNETSNAFYTNAHKIKDDKANEFLKHVYKQSLSVFDSLKEKVNDYNLKRRIDAISKTYDTQFLKFIVETQNQTIKTRHGTQKVILNVIDVSNGLLNRLVSFMLADLAKKDLLRNKMAVNIVEKEVKDVIQMELKHACIKFGVCRTDNTFSKFVNDVLTILLTNNDVKLKQATDAFTETFKNNEYSAIMSDDATKTFYQGIQKAESYDIDRLRPFLIIIRNIITNKHKPFIVTGHIDKRINKTIAFMNMVDIFDKNLPGNEMNSLEWNDIKNSLTEWSDGKRNDIVDISQTLIDYVKKSIDRMDSESVKNINNYINYILLH